VPRVQDLVQLAFTPNQAKHICDPNGGWYQPFCSSTVSCLDEIWVYASATTVTVPTDATTRYSKGMKVRFKQGGGYKYYYVTTLTATVITLAGETVANAVITDLEISRAESPFNFPDFFDWTPEISGGGSMGVSDPVINLARFSIKARAVYMYVNLSCTTAVPVHTDLKFTLPTTINTSDNAGGACRISDTGSGTFGSWLLSNGVCIVRISGEGNWGAGTLRRIILTGFYEF